MSPPGRQGLQPPGQVVACSWRVCPASDSLAAGQTLITVDC